jgi:hypothetical protein
MTKFQNWPFWLKLVVGIHHVIIYFIVNDMVPRIKKTLALVWTSSDLLVCVLSTVRPLKIQNSLLPELDTKVRLAYGFFQIPG